MVEENTTEEITEEKKVKKTSVKMDLSADVYAFFSLFLLLEQRKVH